MKNKNNMNQDLTPDFRPFIGVVENSSDDPLQLGRVKVRIFNETDELDQEDLQWCTVGGIGGNKISPTWIEAGNMVFGLYIDGKNKRLPFILSTFFTIPNADDNLHEVSALARGINTNIEEKVGPEPDTSYAAEYPFNKVIASNKHSIELDDTDGAERIKIRHSSGTYIEISPDGRTVIKSSGDQFNIIKTNNEVYIGGKCNVLVEGDANIQTNGNLSLKSSGNIDITASGNMKLNASRIDLNG